MLTTIRRAVTQFHVLRLHRPLHCSASLWAINGEMRKRDIVSSFICTPPDSEEGLKVALFRRSQNVSTYRGKWAVCSGSIEPTDASPEAAARREIEEETQLTTSDISLLRRGRPFRLPDHELQIEWTIHPFAFVLHDPHKSLVIEGEHTEYRFVPPSSIKDYDTVPALDISTRRVILGPAAEAALSALRTDLDSGADILARRALSFLHDALHTPDRTPATPTEAWRDLRLFAWTLAKNGRPSMAPAIEAALFDAIDRISHSIASAGVDSSPTALDALQLEDFKTLASTAIETTISARKKRIVDLAETFTTFIHASTTPTTRDPLTILTLSFSSTVAACLNHLIRTTPTPIHLLILESRPRFEGVALARELLGTSTPPPPHLTIEVLTDAGVASAARRADFVVLGADAVGSGGEVRNKLGSVGAAVLGRTVGGARVVVVCGRDKIVDGEVSGEGECGDEGEVRGVWPGGGSGEGEGVEGMVVVRNEGFECMEARWVDVYVTEVGVMGREGVEGVARGRGELEERLFGDL